ncbi:MAG TPA: peptidylprolyl isomerase [Gemmatimonadota bacterium]|nr:peptidylprolyl isomerase [Gemmatimonadota bacterium]
MLRSSGIALALSLIATAARAQDVSPPAAALPTDRILAVVGDHLLLESEWRDQTQVLAGQLGVDPTSPDMRDLALEAFEQMVRDLVILVAAERDTSIQVDNERVVEEADEEVARIQSRFPSEQEFLRQLGESQWGTLAAYRADIMERKRRELLGQAYLDLHRSEIITRAVSEAEVREFWEENRESFGRSPQTVRFEEIPVLLSPSDDVREEARAEAERILAELRAGTIDFATAARQHSDDPASSENGGDVGWFGRDRMVEPFERAGFESPTGELVGPVETLFGYHVMQVLDKREEEVRVRHILIAFGRSDADSDAARLRADELAAAVNGGADVDSLQAALMPGDSISAEVIELGQSQVPPVYARGLEGLDPGQATVVETPTGFSVIVSRGTGGGEVITYEEIAPRLRSQLEQQKAEESFVERLRSQVYVDIRIPPERVLQGA